MSKLLKTWYSRNLTHPSSIRMVGIIILCISTICIVGDILTPVAISLIIAYLLDGIVEKLHNFKMSNILSIILVLFIAISILFMMAFLLIPVLWHQLADLVHDIPNIVTASQSYVSSTIERYPEFFSPELIDNFFINFKDEISSFGQFVITFSLSSIPNLIMVVIYLVMIPLLVFFFLIDKQLILANLKKIFSNDKKILAVGREINIKLGSYVRGKFIEMAIVAGVTSITFMILDLNYGLLLGCLVGTSVFIPFVGAIFVTIPIVIIGLLQWGFDSSFMWLAVIYSIILFIDANVLVPFLFAGAMKMHPLTIIIAIFLFGGLWGFWGVFFAIPLAVIIKSVIIMWPKATRTKKSVV